MKISVKVKAGAKQEKIEKHSPDEYSVWVREPAKEGKANDAVRKALAEHFGVAQWRVELVSGFSSKSKVFEIA